MAELMNKRRLRFCQHLRRMNKADKTNLRGCSNKCSFTNQREDWKAAENKAQWLELTARNG